MSGDSLNQQIDGGAGKSGGGGGRQEEGKKPIGYGRKAKRVVLSKIKKAKKRLQRNKSKGKGDSSSSSCCCCLYIRRIPNLDSSSESPKSDPNCSEFGFDSLKGLIEKSDFLLDECNTHLDVYSDSPPHGIHDDDW